MTGNDLDLYIYPYNTFICSSAITLLLLPQGRCSHFVVQEPGLRQSVHLDGHSSQGHWSSAPADLGLPVTRKKKIPLYHMTLKNKHEKLVISSSRMRGSCYEKKNELLHDKHEKRIRLIFTQKQHNLLSHLVNLKHMLQYTKHPLQVRKGSMSELLDCGFCSHIFYFF